MGYERVDFPCLDSTDVDTSEMYSGNIKNIRPWKVPRGWVKVSERSLRFEKEEDDSDEILAAYI